MAVKQTSRIMDRVCFLFGQTLCLLAHLKDLLYKITSLRKWVGKGGGGEENKG